ncbi:polyamine aminopropyltransferase [Rhodovibrio salinarum]|uniref:Polyamine aminopropyltransferase n=1 Tax=Rhodovibrio salinarum TaxID=1087 RepID=A0A934QIB1_9PROT|nr:polyamine aminopropyltransferase [Rhodovibrio salinarum]MBK1697414.1 polyamine aminopropyltransferase [Rhodovibrio salinarum]
MRTFRETLHTGYEQTLHLEGDPLVDRESAFQHLQVFDSVANGRVLVLDGILQLTDRDESAYSEMLVHPPLIEHGNVKRVLIVGGGDGAVAEEVLKHPEVAQVDLVDIDAEVVDVSKEFFAHVNKGAFDDPRLTFYPEDAFEFLGRTEPGTYDLAIADRPDPVGPAQSLFANDFYARLQRALAKRGIGVFQTGCPFYQADELAETHKLLKGVFDEAGVYLTVVPTYTGGFMALTWGSNGLQLGTADAGAVRQTIAASGVETDYYNADIHAAAFALPEWMRRLVR